MSTYYYFACDRCREYGGFYSRQAWGWGNMDIVDTFAFLAHHTGECGSESLRVVSEDETWALQLKGWAHIVNAEDAKDGMTDDERVADYPRPAFPHSNDWARRDELFAAYRERRARREGEE